MVYIEGVHFLNPSKVRFLLIESRIYTQGLTFELHLGLLSLLFIPKGIKNGLSDFFSSDLKALLLLEHLISLGNRQSLSTLRQRGRRSEGF